MSSQEVIKHSRKIFGILSHNNQGIKHKVGEILVEILIIVFAITLSLFLERRREHSQERELEHSFLQGLQNDLAHDVEQLKTSSAKWIEMRNAANYFVKPEAQINWSQDSIDFYGRKLFHNVYYFPSTNRYEALKSSGKIGVIEDNQLQNNVVDLYQTKIPDLDQQIKFFNEFLNTQVMTHLVGNLQRDTNNNAVLDKSLFTDMRLRNILSFYNGIDDIKKRSDSTIKVSEEILQEINKESD